MKTEQRKLKGMHLESVGLIFSHLNENLGEMGTTFFPQVGILKKMDKL